MLYSRIQSFVTTIEEKKTSSLQQKQSSVIKQVRDKESIEKAVLADERSLKWMEGKSVVKIIIVPKKIVNIVIK